MAIALGLAVALVYGAADFLGGRASRHDHPTVVVAVSQATSFGLLVVLLVVDGSPVAGWTSLGFGIGSGLVGLAGVLLLYRGLARGAMGVIAPITAVGAAVVPVTYGLATGERPGATALVGVALALVAVALIASASPAEVAHDAVLGDAGTVGGGPFSPVTGVLVDESHREPAPPARTSASDLALAGAAGAAFGIGFILLAESGDDAGFWPLLAARAASVPVVAVAVRVMGHRLAVRPGNRLAVLGAGTLDVTAIALYLLAARRGLISLVAVLGSLYPVGTVALARLVLGERLVARQLAGLGVALAGVLLIAR